MQLPSVVLFTAMAASVVNGMPAGINHTSTNGISHGITNSSDAIANHTYDYIICGGGLTGLVVASRLTEDPKISVLVIEQGHEHHADPRVNDVRTYGDAFDSELDHGIRSTPVKWQGDKELLLVAGKMLGGSGGLNGASWTKGARSQYDLLPVLTGDQSWGWDSLNKFMLKSEDFHEPSEKQRSHKGANFEPQYHGHGGPVHVSFGSQMFGGIQVPALNASEKVWGKTFVRNSDAASGTVNGGTIIPNMVYDDENQNRSSPFTAYAQQQVQERDNFVILTGHRVTKIGWQDKHEGKLVAEGVQLQASRDSPIKSVKAKREVLLAAGSLQSPQLLELSGVGDPVILKAAGIEVKHSLKGVGNHMQEQTKNTVSFKPRDKHDFEGTGPPSALSFPSARQLLRGEAEQWYEQTKQGLPSYAASLEKRGLVANAAGTQKILEAQLDNLFNTSDAAAAEVFFTQTPAKNQVGVDAWNLIVLSRGNAHINSSDPWAHPIVEPSYFGHPLDLAFQTAVTRESREAFQTSPLSEYVVRELEPGTSVVPENASEKAWEEWVKGSFTSVWHYISTLSMMKEEWGGVVDPRLRVYGLENVRAIDASVLPIQLSAHLSSSLYGIGEKAAAMIKEDQK